MNEQNDTRDNDLIDEDVTKRFSEIRDGQVPEELDVAVLREARRAIRADNRQGSFGAWFRPVAFAVTVGLSLAILLELTDTDDPDQPSLPETTVLPGNARDLDRTNLNELKRQQKPAATGNDDPQKLEAGQPADTLDAAATGTECSEEVKSEPRSWWRCIETLREAGHVDAVQRELELLRERFPDFEPPA